MRYDILEKTIRKNDATFTLSVDGVTVNAVCQFSVYVTDDELFPENFDWAVNDLPPSDADLISFLENIIQDYLLENYWDELLQDALEYYADRAYDNYRDGLWE